MLKLGYCSLHRNLYETNKVRISIIIDRSRFSNSRFPQNYSLVFFFETTIDSLQLSEKSTLKLGFWTFHQMSRQLKRPKNIILVTSYWYSLIARTNDGLDYIHQCPKQLGSTSRIFCLKRRPCSRFKAGSCYTENAQLATSFDLLFSTRFIARITGWIIHHSPKLYPLL